jgi:iron complex outermembrane receptor protein
VCEEAIKYKQTLIYKFFSESQRISVGAEFRDNFQQDQGNKDNYVPRTVYDDHRSTVNFAFFGQSEILILTNLILNAGLRYDHFETFGETVNPRLGLIYSPLQRTTFKALYGTAFKAPNAYELYYTGPNNRGNPSLKPENITTYELVFEQGLNDHIDFSASGIRTRRRSSTPRDGFRPRRPARADQG